MAERTKEEIKTYAERDWFEYIDGYTAQVMMMKHAINQNGEDVWDLVLNPTDKLIQSRNLKPNPDGSMFFRTQIPCNMVIQLNPDPANKKWLCLLTYEGNETEASKILKGIVQQKEINYWKNKWRQEKLRAEVAIEKLELMQNNLPGYLEKNFGPIIEQFEPIISKMAKERENK